MYNYYNLIGWCITIKKIILLIICILLSGCSFSQISDREKWEQWYNEINYVDYISDDYQYTRSLIKIDGTIVDVNIELKEEVNFETDIKILSEEEEQLLSKIPKFKTLLNKNSELKSDTDFEEIKNYKITLYVKEKYSDSIWLCTYYTELDGWLPDPLIEKSLYDIPLITELLEIGENIVIYGHNDKNRDLTKDGEPFIKSLRIDYKNKNYHCIDSTGSFAVKVYEPSFSLSSRVETLGKPFDLTLKDFINNYNQIALNNNFLLMERKNEISMTYSPQYVRFEIPIEKDTGNISRDHFKVIFHREAKSDKIISVEFIANTVLDALSTENNNKTIKAFTLIALSIDNTLNYNDAFEFINELIEDSQYERNGFIYKIDEYDNSCKLTIRKS